MHIRDIFRRGPILALAALLTLAAAPRPAAANTLAQLRILGYFGSLTNATIHIELLDNDKPGTVRNFIRLIESGAFTNMVLHRLEPGFVMQGGAYRAALDYTSLEGIPNFGNITNEYTTGPILSNVRGTLSMAKLDGDPDSASSSFFINLGDNSLNLDNQNGGFTVFARVVRDDFGLIDFWNSLSVGVGLVNLGFDPFKALPVNYAGTTGPTFGQLIYCDITLLKVEVEPASPGMRISWNSALGMTNLVEYATTFSPPNWKALSTNIGTGARLSVTDPVAATTSRFYRVRVR